MDALKTIGLNLYERRIWVALLAKGSATAGELSEMARVPRSRTYDILQSLAEKGLVLIQSSKPLRYVAVDPEEALERLKRFQEEKVREFIERIEEIKRMSVLKELKELYERGLRVIEPEELTGAIKGDHLVRKHLETALAKATKKVNILTTPEDLLNLFSTSFNLLRTAKERGVKIKILTKYDSKIKEILKALSSVAEVRFIDEKKLPLYGRFAIIDDSQILLGLTHPEKTHSTQHLAIWSKSEHTAKDIFIPLFKLAWENSRKRT